MLAEFFISFLPLPWFTRDSADTTSSENLTNKLDGSKSNQSDETSSTLRNSISALEIRRKSESMQKVMEELRELSKKRDQELTEIKKSVKECIEKMSLMNSTARGSSISTVEEIMPRFDYRSVNKPGNLKMLGGVFMLIYLLSSNMCTPVAFKVPRLFTFLHTATTFNHLLMITGRPVWHKLLEWLDVDTDTLAMEEALSPYYHRSGAALSALSIMFLKLQRCTPNGHCSTCLPMFLSIVSYLVKMYNHCYEDPSTPPQESNLSPTIGDILAKNFVPITLTINILWSIFTI